MSNSYNLFPIIDEDLLESIEYQIDDVNLSYFDDGETHNLDVDNLLNLKQKNTVVTIKDSRLVWEPENYELRIIKSITIKKPQLLFGENGITNNDSTLGLAVMWISTKSNQRGIIPFSSFKHDSETVTATFSNIFKHSQLRGSIVLKTVLYLKEPSITFDFKYMANETGTIVGTLDTIEMLIDGDGSSFPIVTVSKENEPLWSVFYNESADPSTDSFDEENVCIMLNDMHPQFDSLKIKDSFKESQIFVEVISSALMIIIQSVKESVGDDWEAMLSDTEVEPGSIAQAIRGFVKDLNWDVSSPNNLSVSIRKFFDENL